MVWRNIIFFLGSMSHINTNIWICILLASPDSRRKTLSSLLFNSTETVPECCVKNEPFKYYATSKRRSIFPEFRYLYTNAGRRDTMMIHINLDSLFWGLGISGIQARSDGVEAKLYIYMVYEDIQYAFGIAGGLFWESASRWRENTMEINCCVRRRSVFVSQSFTYIIYYT